MDTQTLLNKLDTAYKAITTTDMGQGILTEEKASQFIRVVQDSTSLLSLSRRLPMNSHTRDIDRIMFAGRILQKTGGETTAISNEQKTTTYMNQLVAKELGDTAQTGANQLAYKGIVLDYVPQMPAGTCLLAPYNNFVYGIWREIRIEQDRVPKERKTDFVVTLRADCHYEDENASAVATGYVGI